MTASAGYIEMQGLGVFCLDCEMQVDVGSVHSIAGSWPAKYWAYCVCTDSPGCASRGEALAGWKAVKESI